MSMEHPEKQKNAVKSVVDQVMDGIISQIIDGTLHPGDKLPTEMELCKQFGAGRNSVREAVKKLQAYGITMTEHLTVSDGLEQVAAAIAEMRKKPVDMILCTGGMSVDPDDNTPGAIARSGARIVTYGAAVLPGAMFLLGYYEDGQPVMGLPGCVMYAKATILDLILPRVAAGLQVTNQEIAVLDSYLKWELELGEPLGAFGGPILWVSHDRDECQPRAWRKRHALPHPAHHPGCRARDPSAAAGGRGRGVAGPARGMRCSRYICRRADASCFLPGRKAAVFLSRWTKFQDPAMMEAP